MPLFPNGIAFGVDDRLYVAQSMTQKILVMDSVPEPTIQEFATLPSGYPDGFCFDRAGRLYCAGSLGDVVVVFEPDGKRRRGDRDGRRHRADELLPRRRRPLSSRSPARDSS